MRAFRSARAQDSVSSGVGKMLVPQGFSGVSCPCRAPARGGAMTAGTPLDPCVMPAGESTTAPKATRSGRHRPRVRPYHKHGLTTLRRTVEAIGGRLLDGRTTLAKQLAAWKADLVRDLGGDVSTQQAAVIDLAVRTRLLLDSIDAWLLTQPSLVNQRKRALLPVVRERQALADALARYLAQLGLERRQRPVPDLSAYLAQRQAQPPPEREPEASS